MIIQMVTYTNMFLVKSFTFTAYRVGVLLLVTSVAWTVPKKFQWAKFCLTIWYLFNVIFAFSSSFFQPSFAPCFFANPCRYIFLSFPPYYSPFDLFNLTHVKILSEKRNSRESWHFYFKLLYFDIKKKVSETGIHSLKY